MTTPIFFGSEVYRGSSYGRWHPLRIPRVPTVMDLARAMGWLPTAQYRTSPRAKPAALTLWHTPEYLDALSHAEAVQQVDEAIRDRHGLGTVSNPVFPEMYRRPATGAGASLLAGELLADGGVIYHPGGGTHHAFPDRANGFCYLNDPVLAILSLKRAGARRVAYIDIDAHHCDGVEHGFAGDPETLLISTHEERRWPFTGVLDEDGGGNCLNLPLPRGLNDSEMAEIRERLILPALAGFAPDAIVLQCGADAVEEDPLSRLALSNNAHFDILRGIMALGCPRLLVLGGGGYNPWSVGRLWTGIWATLNGHDIPDRLPPESEAALRALHWDGARAGRTPPAHWFTTIRDKPRPGPVRPEVAQRLAHLRERSAARGEMPEP
ncbi:acetoin utilization protein AcuC [Roseibacterium beibuensis]|uniref:Acetoin utilization protein AcuC n=1 Tax=[Roseibacterium] beibuensis TaxID=1193142 RepID=A0ABP9KU09_9RHOB|nr:acetoin utilization protein AcuC [Roseibacterium beibuensis]MCS6622146.1 acetoin utilization protein AcuC [Roseibacterium beibuensis]